MAIVVGTTTRGWGSVEDTYPLTTVIDPTTGYSILLVNSLTLRDDEQPVEQNGVVPDVDTSSPQWKARAAQLITSSSLLNAVFKMQARTPWTY